jgi:hypothetical protein
LACAFQGVKAFRSLNRIVLLAAFLAGTASAASAQSESRLARGDLAGTIGWLSADTHPSGPYNDNNWESSFFGAASVGWYWTENLKSEVDFGTGTKARVLSTEPIVISGRTTYVTTDSKFARRTFGISQQYQFLHNAWFHPHLAAGVNLTWERRTKRILPIYLYDEVTRTSRIVTLEQHEDPRTSVTARPFVAAGFKAYMTPRTFFRNDFRVAFRSGPDETLLRIGFGVDF